MVGSVTSVGGAGNTAPTTSGASKTTKVGQIEGAAPDGWHLPSASEAGGCLPVRFWSIETPKQTQPRWSLAPLLVSLNAPLTGCPPRLYPSGSPWLSADVASERLSDPFRTAEAPQALPHLSLPRAGRSRCVSCIVKANPKMDHSGDAREMHRTVSIIQEEGAAAARVPRVQSLSQPQRGHRMGVPAVTEATRGPSRAPVRSLRRFPEFVLLTDLELADVRGSAEKPVGVPRAAVICARAVEPTCVSIFDRGLGLSLRRPGRWRMPDR